MLNEVLRKHMIKSHHEKGEENTSVIYTCNSKRTRHAEVILDEP